MRLKQRPAQQGASGMRVPKAISQLTFPGENSDFRRSFIAFLELYREFSKSVGVTMQDVSPRQSVRVLSALRPVNIGHAARVARTSHGVSILRDGRDNFSKEDIYAVRKRLFEIADLRPLLPEHIDLVGQSVDIETVHPLSEEDFIKLCLGVQQIKDTIALALNTNEGSLNLGNIRRVHFEAPQTKEGYVDVRNLLGDVDAIIQEDNTPLTGRENVTGYHSICAGKYTNGKPVSGAARVLIQRLDEITPPGRIETTISPVRDFTDAHDRDVMLAKSDHDIRRHVVNHLIGCADSVESFHVGTNGAYVGWVNVNRKSKRDWVTVNYVYERPMCAENLERVKKDSQLPMSAPLQEYASKYAKHGTYAVRGDEYVRPSVPLPALDQS